MYSFSFNTHGYRPTFRNFKTCVTKTLPTKMVRELDTPLRSCKVHSNRGHLGSTLHICLSKAFSYYSQKKKTGRTFFTKSYKKALYYRGKMKLCKGNPTLF